MSRRGPQPRWWPRFCLVVLLAGAGAAPVRAAAPDAGTTTAAPSWAPSLTMTMRPSHAHVGDPLTVTLVARCPQGVAVNLPLQLTLGDFVELGRSESSSEPTPGAAAAPRVQTFSLRLAAYKLGTLTLPALPVTAIGKGGELLTLRTEPRSVRISSVMANEPNPRLKALEPPVVVYRRTWWLLYLVGGVLAAAASAALSVLAYRRLQARRQQRPPPQPLPAHQQALERLAALPIDPWLAEQRQKTLYAALSEILRAYLGARWGFEALEMTTSEVQTALILRLVPAEQRARVQGLCQVCDLVKFAKLQPEDQAARQAVAEVEAIVRVMAASAEAGLRPATAPIAAVAP
ncbi:MAG: hypothetical protein IPL40_00180 [Proteobacteria bacterium]|nr:hypothetical protein [Pseudomonadota bacterium]